jgi:hypothetical protein
MVCGSIKDLAVKEILLMKYGHEDKLAISTNLN